APFVVVAGDGGEVDRRGSRGLEASVGGHSGDEETVEAGAGMAPAVVAVVGGVALQFSGGGYGVDGVAVKVGQPFRGLEASVGGHSGDEETVEAVCESGMTRLWEISTTSKGLGKGKREKKVAKHQRYLAGKEGSDPDSHAPKPTKATKKSKPSAPKAAPVTKPAAAQQPKPKPAPAKSLSLVDEFVDEEANMQRAVEESLKSVHDAHRGPLSPVVIKEPDSGKFQPLPKEGSHVVRVRAQDKG
nr:hypothetical protein [Tanacetum cinerariifolium]